MKKDEPSTATKRQSWGDRLRGVYYTLLTLLVTGKLVVFFWTDWPFWS